MRDLLIRLSASLCLFGLTTGCGNRLPTSVSVEKQDPLIAPEQLSAIQTGLYSQEERTVLSSLTTLERFPMLCQAHRQRIESLSQEGSEAVKRQAKKLLQNSLNQSSSSLINSSKSRMFMPAVNSRRASI
jgi:hypothetical protein